MKMLWLAVESVAVLDSLSSLSLFWLGFSFLYVLSSIRSVDVNEVALEYNSISKQVNADQVFGNGRPYIGVGHRFIKYPTDVLTIDFVGGGTEDTEGSVTARTKDGLSLSLELNFQYQLKTTKADLLYLYNNYFEDYQTAFEKVARNVVRDVAADFNALSFYESRAIVAAAMRAGIEAAFADLRADIQSFSLTNFEYPTLFSQAIERTQQAQINIGTNEANFQNVKSESQQILNYANSYVSTIRSEAETDSLVLEQHALAEIQLLNQTLRAEADALKKLRSDLNLTNNEDLLTYIWLDAYTQLPPESTVLNLVKPTGLDVQ